MPQIPQPMPYREAHNASQLTHACMHTYSLADLIVMLAVGIVVVFSAFLPMPWWL